MVRRKEDLDAEPIRPVKNIKIAHKQEVKAKPQTKARSAEVESMDEMAQKPVRTHSRKSGSGWRIFWASLVVVLLLGLGWFGTRLIVNAMAGKGTGLAGLFNLNSTKLTGEDQNQVNILLIGNAGGKVNDAPDLTDTMMLASYNPETKFLHLISIPRDLWVTLPSGGGSMKVNAVYEAGQAKDGQGAQLLTSTMSDLLGVTIPYYMRIDFQGFQQIVDQLGGVQVVVAKDLYDPLYPTDNKGYQTLDIKAGTYTMGGDMALKYARSRETTSDFDRARRQQELIMAIRQKALDLDLLTTPTKMFAITDILADHFATNFTKPEMQRLMGLMVDFDPANSVEQVMDDSTGGALYDTRVNDAFVLKPVGDDYAKLKDFVAQALNATTAGSSDSTTATTPTAEPLKIEVLNGTNVTGLAGKMATKLKAAGMTIVRAGNSPTKGVAKSVIYDNTNGAKAAAIRQLMDITGATLSTDKLTLPTSVEVRLVVGADAEAALK